MTNYEIEVEIIENKNNKNESFMIYKDFELIDKNIMKFLIEENIPYHVLKCSFLHDNTIIIQYPINKTGNKNYICVISKIDAKRNLFVILKSKIILKK